jgi:hypothetical protein
MTQRELDCAVAVATGESLPEVRRHGFSIADPVDVDFDPEPCDLPPQWLDWEEVQAVDSVRPVCRRRHLEAV